MAPVIQSNKTEIQPIKSMEELLQWKEPTSIIEEIVYGKELQPRAPSCTPERLKTLICHDMKGGYLDDRFYSGCSNKDAYRFYHWTGVDMFIYFSHHLVTIPPPCWVNAAHLHGIKVLGTFITEWDAGADICRKLLSDHNSVTEAVDQMVKIAKYHRFEGWLINIENIIDMNKVDMLVIFVQKLKEAMQALTSEAVVLWYDSVTKEGKLDWQNELNHMNRCFFDACDGIFLNYTWTPEHLKRSREAAGERNTDVFVGLDVFGRNFYEGGKYNTYKALEVTRAHQLSAALFAQGWTYETNECFEEAEEKLWQSLSPYLFHHGPKQIPFSTSFCQGMGDKTFCLGQCDDKGAWHNLSKQQYQPIWPHEKDVRMELFTGEAYSGGGCLKLIASAPVTVRLFVCEIQWTRALLVNIVYKWCKDPVALSVILDFSVSSADNETSSVQSKVLQLEGESLSPDCKTIGEGPLTEKVVDTQVEGWNVKTFSVPEEQGILLNQLSIKLSGTCAVLIGCIDIKNICIKGLQV